MDLFLMVKHKIFNELSILDAATSGLLNNRASNGDGMPLQFVTEKAHSAFSKV